MGNKQVISAKISFNNKKSQVHGYYDYSNKKKNNSRWSLEPANILLIVVNHDFSVHFCKIKFNSFENFLMCTVKENLNEYCVWFSLSHLRI